MIDLDLSDPVNQVRLIIGDPDMNLISDSNIQFLLDKNDGNILDTAVECLNSILSYLAYSTREETGDVKAYWNYVYDQLKDRLDSIEKDQIYKKTKNLFYFGGTVKSDVRANKRSDERVRTPIDEVTLNRFLDRLPCYNPTNPYSLCPC